MNEQFYRERCQELKAEIERLKTIHNTTISEPVADKLEDIIYATLSDRYNNCNDIFDDVYKCIVEFTDKERTLKLIN